MSTQKKFSVPFATVGLGKDRDYFVENLALLVSSGMPVIDALESIMSEVRSGRMKKILKNMRQDIDDGTPLWKTLANTGLFKSHTISLIQLGEESGRLVENLRVISVEEEKDRAFKSKMRSAMTYPVFVLCLTAVVGVGISWFILPKLALVFSQLKVKLPLITKLLIDFGTFLEANGRTAVPIAIAVLFFLTYFIFVFPKTKVIGQYLLFLVPGIKDLMKEVEVARFGYLLGTLLKAGLPITQALHSLANATEFYKYKKLYLHIGDAVDSGDSLQKSLSSYKRINSLIPAPIQHLIVAGEQSGNLAPTLVKIGENFEAKADTTTKNLTVILEPLLLVIVWLGVVAVALAVILPIYSLVGNLNTGV